MNRAERREALIRLHAAKFMHARMLGYHAEAYRTVSRINVHHLQIMINMATKNVKPN